MDTNILDPIVHQKDLDYLKQQILEMQIIHLSTDQLELPDSVITKELPLIITDDPKTFFPGHSTFLISWPVFSTNKDLALIYEKTKCGLDCGGGQIYYFLKNDQGNWEKIGFIVTSFH